MSGKHTRLSGAFPSEHSLRSESEDQAQSALDVPLTAYLSRKGKQSNLKILRRARGLTLESLSELTGISPSYLSRLEGGARRLNADLLDRLSAVLGCQPGDLLGMHRNVASGTKQGGARGRVSSITGLIENAPDFSVHNETAVSSTPQKDLPVYTGIYESVESSVIDFSTPADWTFRPPQLLGIRSAFAMYVRDQEGMPRYKPGDMLFVHPIRPLAAWCSVVLAFKDGRVAIRQFNSQNGNALIVAPFSDQGEGAVEEVRRSDLRFAHRIIGVLEDC